MFSPFKKLTHFNTLMNLGISLGFLSSVMLGNISEAIANDGMSNHNVQKNTQKIIQNTNKPTEFRRIDQPFTNQAIVSIISLGLISLEIWWFLISKPPDSKTNSHSNRS